MKVLMCGSTLNTKGGMVSVVKNYLNYSNWGDCDIIYVPTHFDSKYKKIIAAYFLLKYCYIVFLCIFCGYKIIHLHTAERGSFWRKMILVKTLKKIGAKTIMHHHAAEFETFYENCSPEKRDKIKNVLELTDVNIVLSKRLVPMIKDKAPNANVVVLYNAVNTPSTNTYNLNAKNVLFLGRLGQRKGTYDLIEAIYRIDSRIPQEVKFYLCGDMGEEETKSLIKYKHIEHRIAHVGWVDGNKKNEFFSNSMINCLPSYNEGLPMTILETMAHGIPNISTNIASIPEVINHGDNGFMVKPGDVDSLTDFLLQLIENDEMRKRMSEASYNLIKNKFSIDNNITLLKSIYNSFSGK